MRKEIVEVDKKKGVYQITCTDERWYTFSDFNKELGLPEYRFVPSVTWITSYVYKGVEFYKWLASKGWDEAEAIKEEAGREGTAIHQVIEALANGEAIRMDAEFTNPDTEKKQELSPNTYGAANSFVRWYNDAKPEFLFNEIAVVSKKYEFAGTVDTIAMIDGEMWIIDWKSSQYIWPSMKAQLSAYKRALIEMAILKEIKLDPKLIMNARLGILQVGYKRNKRAWKFNEIQDEFDELFIPAKAFWTAANKNTSPRQYQLPLELKLELPKKTKKTKAKKCQDKKPKAPAKD